MPTAAVVMTAEPIRILDASSSIDVRARRKRLPWRVTRSRSSAVATDLPMCRPWVHHRFLSTGRARTFRSSTTRIRCDNPQPASRGAFTRLWSLVMISERLTYHPLTDTMLDDFHRLVQDESVRRYLMDGEILPREWRQERVRDSASLFGRRHVRLWLTCERQTGATVGFCGFLEIPSLHPEPQLVYAIFDRFTRAAAAGCLCGLEWSRPSANTAIVMYRRGGARGQDRDHDVAGVEGGGDYGARIVVSAVAWTRMG